MTSSLCASNLLPLVALAAAATGAHAQSVWVVDAALGPGAHFPQITDAIAAASDGDVVLVRSGTYDGFTIDGLDVVVTADLTANVEVAGTVTVRNVSAGKSVTLRRLAGASTTGPGLLAEDSAGKVWVEKCDLVGRDGVPGAFARAGAQVEDCAAVTFLRCGLTGGDGASTGGGAGQSGRPGISVFNSSVAIHESTLVGGSGSWGDDIGGFAGAGLSVEGSSFVLAAGSTFDGGDGGGADDDYDFFTGSIVCGYCAPGGSGVETWSFTTGTVALLDNTYLPGQGGVSTSAKGCPDGADGVPIQDYGGVVTELPGSARGLRAGSPRREGENAALTFTGEAGDLVVLLFASEQAHAPFPQFLGTLLVGPAPTLLALGSAPAGGVLQIPFTTPDLPAGVQADTFYLQSLVLSIGLEVVLGAASQVTILDASL